MFESIKNRLNNPKVRHLFGTLGEEYTEAIIDMKLAQYHDDAAYSIYGWLEQDEILGICGFVFRDDCIYIHDLAVDEDVRGRGIGSAMIAVLQEKFTLPITAETDDEAVEFYRKIGFDVSDVPPKHGMRWYALYRSI